MQLARPARTADTPPSTTPIATVQGSGDSSPLINQPVQVSGIVTGIQRTGEAMGFYLQDAGDGDAQTSDGLFVRMAGPSTAWLEGMSIGSRATADGIVSEKNDLTAIDVAQAVGVQLGTKSSLAAITPQELDVPIDPAQRAAYLEAREGMLVSLSSALVVGPTTGWGQYVAVDATKHGMRRMGSTPDRTGPMHVDGRLGPKTQLAVGDQVTGIKGPLGMSAGNYVVLPVGSYKTLERSARPPRAFGDIDGDDRFTDVDVRAVKSRVGETARGPLDPADLNGDGKVTRADVSRLQERAARITGAPLLKVATLNAQNFFDSVDAPAPIADDVPSANEYRTKLAKLAGTVRDLLGAPDLLALEEVENTKVLDDLLARPELAGLGYQYVLLPTNGARSINPALLYRTSAATVLGSSQLQQTVGLGEHAIADGVHSIADARAKGALFSRQPLLVDLQLAAAADGTPGRELSVIVNHLVSKFSPYGVPTDTMRVAQATYLREQVTRLRTEHPEREVVVLGDLNDTPGSAALKALTGPGRSPTLIDASAELVPEGERYSFIYQGRSELIDHILVTPGLEADVERAGVRHGNADLPVGDPWDAGPTRASDHDSPYVWLRVGAPAPAPAP
ncbi:MAG: endonuclease/exonuclease/phosphatase family protein [Thermoleophilia bacterium]|nr:endonuclease/exonuclease/phosphatase family protein [Thermoleophilia bacterium]